MNLLLPADVEALLEERPGPCISIYLSNLHTGTRTAQGAIRLRHLLDRLGEELSARGFDESAGAALLVPLEELLDDAMFWNRQEEGVALFRAPGFTRTFHLPRAFVERSTVGEHFIVKPLLPLVAGDDVFYVLALSQNEVRLLEATGGAVRRLGSGDLPHSLVDALGEQKTAQYLQYHTASSAAAGVSAVYHGHGVGPGDTKDELRRYVRQIEAAVRKLLAGRTAPLVLAGAEPLPSLYREIGGSAHLADATIPGNPEPLADEELGERGRQLLAPVFQETRRRAAARFAELAGTGRASSDVTEILPAARHGRVEALFVACNTDLWGRLDPLEKVEVHAAPQAGDEELLDAAALFSLRYGGTVYGLDRGEVPGGGDLAAVFRY